MMPVCNHESGTVRPAELMDTLGTTVMLPGGSIIVPSGWQCPFCRLLPSQYNLEMPVYDVGA